LESSPLSNISFGFLKGVISTADLTPFVTGSAQPQVTIDSLKKFKLLIPSPEILRCYESFSSAFEDQIELNNEQIQTLANLRDTLLPRLISGQLRIADADPQLNKEVNS
jgi:type I restriction enzyme S subunit